MSRPLPGAARLPVDGAARRDRRRLAARGDAVHPAQPGDHAEPALHREPGQPGRLRQRRGRPQRRRLRPAAQRQRADAARHATCGRCSSRARATLPPLPLEWTLVNNDPDRPGNSVLFSGNASNLDRTAVTRVTVPAGSPSLTFLAKYGAEAGFDYGYVARLHRRRGDLHATRRRPDRRRSARPGAQRDDGGLRAAHVRPHAVRRAADPARVPLHQRRVGQRGWPAHRRHHGRRHAGQRRLAAWRRSTRRPRCVRRRCPTGTCG